jgi:hypothetical protein
MPYNLVHHHLTAQMDFSGGHEATHYRKWSMRMLVHRSQHVLVTPMSYDYAPSHIEMRVLYSAQYIRESRNAKIVEELSIILYIRNTPGVYLCHLTEPLITLLLIL